MARWRLSMAVELRVAFFSAAAVGAPEFARAPSEAFCSAPAMPV